MNSNTATLILAAVAAFCMPVFGDALGPVVTFTPGAQTVTVGSTVPVDVTTQNVEDLYGFQFDVSFDPSVLSAVSVTQGTSLPADSSVFWVLGGIDNTAGTISGIYGSEWGATPGLTDGSLATVVFQALAPGTSQLTLLNVELYDSNLNPIANTIAGGSITVNQAQSGVPEPGTAMLLGGSLLILSTGLRRKLLSKQ